MARRIPLACLAAVTALALGLIIGPATASAGTIAPVYLNVYGPYFANQGQQATYTYEVYNPGTTDIPGSAIVVQDDHCSPVSGPTGDNGDGALNPGEYWDYTCTTTVTEDPGTTVVHDVTADGAEQTFDTYVTDLQITKTVDQATADPYDTLNYTITVTNNGPPGESYEGYVSDQNCGTLTPTDPQMVGSNFTLNPGQSESWTCSATFSPGDDGKYTNEACANAYPFSQGPAQAQEIPPLVVCADATTSLAQHSVSGRVFEDMNADGVEQSGEPPLPGVVVYADLNNNGVRDPGEPSSTSDGQGNYSVSVQLGTTTIREDVSGNLTCSFPAGCAYTVDLPKNSPPPPPPPPAGPAVQARAADPTGKDFGDWRPASVSGTVVDDKNGNGTRDSGEAGLAGVQVYGDLNNNGILDQGEPTATTASDGTYTIAGLKPGGYVIRHVVPAGRTCTAPAGCNYDLTLVSNGAATNKDFLDASPRQVVLPASVGSASVRVAGVSGCVGGSGFSARVRGRQMQRVVFSVDGHVVKTLVLPKDNATYRYRVNVSRLSRGSHLLTVRVTFRNASRTKSKTVRVRFSRCVLRAPHFTG